MVSGDIRIRRLLGYSTGSELEICCGDQSARRASQTFSRNAPVLVSSGGCNFGWWEVAVMAGVWVTLDERRVIGRGYRAGLTQRHIAAAVGKHPSTVCRELKRSFSAPGVVPRVRGSCGVKGRGTGGVYDAERAQADAAIKARRPKARRLDHAVQRPWVELLPDSVGRRQGDRASPARATDDARAR
ncbi:helix-turn-helix domain-containing protein [Nocardioides dongxiaopingii]|uniref:helix-turn-helix domain-containing protein n=1 Tax=Nocardioides sp. S-1144 TaxID=2582905 RepID=UPI00110F37C6|nr:helix-turn-helix domain-containing protein [Nocardioides sp. S-1144]